MEDWPQQKRQKKNLVKVSKKLVDTADRKAKEAEKQKDATAMKALLMEWNAARSRSEEIQKKEIPAQEKEIKKIERKLKNDYREVLAVLSFLNCFTMLLHYILSQLFCAILILFLSCSSIVVCCQYHGIVSCAKRESLLKTLSC